MWQVKEKSNIVQRLVGMQWLQFVHSLEIWTGGLDACGHHQVTSSFNGMEF